MNVTITHDEILIVAKNPQVEDLDYLIHLFKSFRDKWEMNKIE